MVAPDEKRRRTEQPTTGKAVERSRIYQPFRAIGYITTEIPVVIEHHGQDFFMTTSVGRSFQTYNLARMTLIYVSQPVEETITAMTAARKIIYIAFGSTIAGYKRGREIKRIGGEGSYTIIQLMHLGGDFLAALCDDNVLRIWDFATGEDYSEIEFGESFTATTMVHPSTYLNKILVGSTQGAMQIWNFRTSKMVYQFEPFSSAITCLVQSPVVDVVAIGLLDGSAILHNIRINEKIDSVRQDDRVTAISFRTDEEVMMATANMHGDVALWDLQERRLVHTMLHAHSSLISSVHFLAGQPVLLTSGADNAVKQWKFEKHNVEPHFLKGRSGHHAPPSKIRFYGENGKHLLSAGRDQSLRSFSIVRDSQSVELSQGSIDKKAKQRKVTRGELMLPVVTDFAASTTKEKQWDNIVTCHVSDSGARTWSYKNKALGKHVLRSADKSALKVTNISACGNFAFIGCASGAIEMYNLQSGLKRKSFVGHKKAITGLASDNTNRFLISSSMDRTVRIWSFQKCEILHTIELEAPVVAIEYHRENDLLAVVCDDLGIRVIDVDTLKIVREFWGHRNRITDFCFSPDGRWIISASLDNTIRTWDLPTSSMIDIFKTEDIVSSLSFSPTGDFLATTHVDNIGIFLWANRTQFTNVPLRSIADDEVAQVLSLPSLAEGDAYDAEEEVAPQSSEDLTTSEQLADALITMSMEPKAKWQNLLSLETIKKRNKPKEAPKPAEKAPFFLPTVAGAKAQFDLSQPKQEKETHSRISHGTEMMDIETEFSQLLAAGSEKGDYTAFVDYAKSLSPSALDVQMRTLPVNENLSTHQQFVSAILFMLRTRKNFEMAQAWLNVFLTIHGDLIIANPLSDIHATLKETLAVQNQEFGRLSEQIHYGLCMIDFARK